MNKFWESINKLLRSQQPKAPSVPFIHEVYKVSEEELNDFGRWSDGSEREELQAWIQSEFARHQHNLDRSDFDIDFLDTKSANGFVIFLQKKGIRPQSARHLIRYFMEKIKPEGYLVYMSDIRSQEKNGRIEKVLRHYLKPRIKYDGDRKLMQLFGNISLEIISHDGKEVQLRVSALTKRDHSMDTPQSINQLYELILS